MKNLPCILALFALVAFVNSESFAQVYCGGTNTVEFANIPGTLSAGQSGQFNFKISTQSTTGPSAVTYYTISTNPGSIVAFGGTHTGNVPYTYAGQGTGVGTVNFSVNTPNSPGVESFFVRVAVNNNIGSANTQPTCFVSGNITVGTTPIELLSFTGKQNNEGGVHLDWVTASEKNNAMFLVERSNNGTDFTQVGEVKGAGTSGKTINYTFNDGSALNDAVNYYRLTDVDLNGVKTPSRIISVVVGKNAPLSIYTISAQQGWVSVVSPIAGEAVLNITNAQGQVMSNMKTTLTEGENQVNINTASLNTGIYILNITNNGRVAQTKFFKAN